MKKPNTEAAAWKKQCLIAEGDNSDLQGLVARLRDDKESQLRIFMQIIDDRNQEIAALKKELESKS